MGDHEENKMTLSLTANGSGAVPGTLHMATYHPLVLVKVQTGSLLEIQSCEDQRLRSPSGIQTVLSAAPSSVAEGRQELN